MGGAERPGHGVLLHRGSGRPRSGTGQPHPLAIALDEGPRVVGNMAGCDVDDITVGMAVEAAYEDIDDTTLLGFRPVG